MSDGKLLIEMGCRINIRRKELGLTQEQLAEKIDVSVQMISNLELGKKAVRPENLVKLCTVLSVSADYILMGKKSEHEMFALASKYKALSEEKQDLIDKLIKAMM